MSSGSRYDRVSDFLTTSFGSRTGGSIVALLWPGYRAGHVLKALPRRLIGSIFNKRYETRTAPFIAARLPWLLWPAYRLLRAFNICFVVNIAAGTGHIIAEPDNFFRMRHLGEIDPGKRYVWLMSPSDRATTCVHLYRHKFWWASSSRLVYSLSLPITMAHKDIILDAGLSRMKWQLTNDKRYYRLRPKETYLYSITTSDAEGRWVEYYKRRLKTPDYFPMSEAELECGDLTRFLKRNTENLALIHVRLAVANATAKPTEPETYLDTLEYLADLGYQLVFIGREKMPDAFRSTGIFNYAESPVASFRNDIVLFSIAQLAITAGSGIAAMAEAFQKLPYLYLNSWHISGPFTSRYCVCVPTLAQTKQGKFLSFREQIELFNSLPEKQGTQFPVGRYMARNGTSDEILAAARELISLKEHYVEPSPLQQRFSRLDDGQLRYSQTRCSEQFLRQHVALL